MVAEDRGGYPIRSIIFPSPLVSRNGGAFEPYFSTHNLIFEQPSEVTGHAMILTNGTRRIYIDKAHVWRYEWNFTLRTKLNILLNQFAAARVATAEVEGGPADAGIAQMTTRRESECRLDHHAPGIQLADVLPSPIGDGEPPGAVDCLSD